MNTKKAPAWPLILASCVLLTALFFFLTAVFTAHLQYPFSFMTYGGTFAVHSIEIGSVSLSLYWFWQIVGIICMTLLCLHRRRRYGIPAALAATSFDSLSLNIGQDGTGVLQYALPAQMDEFIMTSDVLGESDVAALKAYYEPK